MSETTEPKDRFDRAGEMRGENSIKLHSFKAQALFHGRKASRDKPDIYGLVRFSGSAKQVYLDAGADNPWADYWLLKIDQKIAEATGQLEQVQGDLETKNPPSKNVTIGDSISVEPIEVPLNFANNFIFRTAFLIGQYDEICCKILSLRHVGLLTRNEAEKTMKLAAQKVRAVLSSCKGYRHTGVTRNDVVANNQVAQKTKELLGNLPKPVLEMHQRSEYAPEIKQYAAQNTETEEADDTASDELSVPVGAAAGKPNGDAVAQSAG